jgi:hypothetical protein
MQNCIIPAVSEGSACAPGSLGPVYFWGFGPVKRVLAGRRGIANHSQLIASHEYIRAYGGKFGPASCPRNALQVAKMKLMQYMTLYISQFQSTLIKYVIIVEQKLHGRL